MCNFRVGQKVALVGSFGPMAMRRASEEGVSLPVKEAIYTVREHDPDAGTDDVYIRLVEIRNVLSSDGFEPSFEAALFRPVAERGTENGMSILRDILNKTDNPARVEA